MNKILIILLFGVIQTFANNFSMFIGTYAEKEANIEAYLLSDKKVKKNDRWSLTNYTENLLETKYKTKIEKINLVLKNNFSENTKNLVSSSDIRDRKMSFIHVDSFHNFVVSANQVASGIITFNLTYVEIGEEPNRMTSQDTFETRYTKGITLIANTALNENFTLENIYKKGFDKALGNLLDSIIDDNENKVADNISSDDVYFIIQAFNLKNDVKELSKQIFGSESNAKRQLLMMLQESLIRKIRKEVSLNDVVLLYPNTLNEYIFKNWDEYLNKIKNVSQSDLKDRNAQIVIRDIKPVCKDIEFDGRYEFLNGYRIQAMLTDIADKKVSEDSTETEKAIYTSTLGRIVIPLYKKKNINSQSLPSKIIEKPKMYVSQKSIGYKISKRQNTRRDYEIISVIKDNINNLSEKIFVDIKDVIKQRKNKIVMYENFCKGK